MTTSILALLFGLLALVNQTKYPSSVNTTNVQQEQTTIDPPPSQEEEEEPNPTNP